VAAKRAVTEHTDFVVGAFQASVGEAGLDGEKDAVKMSSYRSRETDEGLKP
jgi:hypothetical protein